MTCCLSSALALNAMGSAKKKLGAVMGFFHRAGDGHNRIPYRCTWRPMASAAIVVLMLSFGFAISSPAQKSADVASFYSNLGGNFYSRGQYREAVGYYEKALASDLEALGEKHPNTATDYNNLGAAWVSLKQYQKAIGYFEKALAIDRETLGEKHPGTATD